MIGRKRFSISLASAIAGVALLFGMTAMQTSAEAEIIAVGSATVAVGGEATVDASSLHIAGEGLGAWSVDVQYDSAVISAESCTAEHGGACNPDFADGVVRFTGGSAAGLLGDTKLAAITFACLTAGASNLTVVISDLADATLGAPQPLAANIQNGRIACITIGSPPPSGGDTPDDLTGSDAPDVPSGGDTSDVLSGSDTSDVLSESLPDAGTGPGSLGTANLQIWLIAGLIGAGIAWLSTGITGAGLAFVSGSNRSSQRASARQQQPAPEASGPFVQTSARAAGAAQPRRRALSWLIAAREELANAKLGVVPGANLRRRR